MKLTHLVSELADAEPADALEMLIEMGDGLPELAPERSAVVVVPACRIQECQSPVYLKVAIIDGRLSIDAHVPEKSPTVRGLVAMLVEGLSGATLAELESVPDDLLPALGLEQALGMQRRHGLRGIVARIKREAQREASTGAIRGEPPVSVLGNSRSDPAPN